MEKLSRARSNCMLISKSKRAHARATESLRAPSNSLHLGLVGYDSPERLPPRAVKTDHLELF